MDLKGRIENLYRDFKTGKWNILLSLDNYPSDELNDLLECNIDIRLKKHFKKRSLDANAYFYVLVNKIAEKEHISDEEVHDRLLAENRCYIIENEAVDWMVADWKSSKYRLVRINDQYYYDSLQDVILQKPGGGTYKAKGEPKRSRIFWHIKGSHQMDSKEMARLIDSTVQEAKGLGIETLPQAQLEIMNKEWNNDKKRM